MKVGDVVRDRDGHKGTIISFADGERIANCFIGGEVVAKMASALTVVHGARGRREVAAAKKVAQEHIRAEFRQREKVHLALIKKNVGPY